MERYVHLECGRCGERLYTDLVDFVQAEGSQPHLDAEIYTNQEPDSLAHLCDKEVHGCRGISFNCSQDCHPMQFLIDKGTGIVDRKNFKFALACGDHFVRIVEVPKLALVLTVAAHMDALCSTLSFTSAAGQCLASLAVEEPDAMVFRDVRAEAVALLELETDTIPKFVLADGLLLDQDHDDRTIADIFATPVS
ncbi:unnamed protein product [Effrenium voratum]|uniref:Uncharacterized protein n=1 Tax=Effrenium voratum TaxID=2562239 RepID=A0AA36JIR1_9DINO|nr:unnamed protein product [Effrenium voratum]